MKRKKRTASEAQQSAVQDTTQPAPSNQPHARMAAPQTSGRGVPPSRIDIGSVQDERVRSFLYDAQPGQHLSLDSLSRRPPLPPGTAVKPMEAASWAAPTADERAGKYLQQCCAHVVEEYLEHAKGAVEQLRWAACKEKLAYGGFNVDDGRNDPDRTPTISQQLAKVGCRLREGQGLLLACSADLPAEGLKDNIVFVQAEASDSSGDATGEVKTKGKARGGKAFGFYVVVRVMPITNEMAKVMRSRQNCETFGRAPVDHSFCLLVLSSLLPTAWLTTRAGGRGRYRKIFYSSIAFIRPFKSVFASASLLHEELRQRTIPPGTLALLQTVVDEKLVASAAAIGSEEAEKDTVVPFDAMQLCQSEALLGHHCNEDQARTVAELQRVCHVVHGPPGTGKSTTIFHLINVRVPPDASVLVTAVRNAALGALTSKLTKSDDLARDIVVYGSSGRIADTCLPFTLQRQVHRSGDSAEDAVFRRPQGLQQGGGDELRWSWINLAFLVLRGLRGSLAEARGLRELAGNDAFSSVAAIAESFEFEVKTFSHLEQVDKRLLHRLEADARLTAFNPLPEAPLQDEAGAGRGSDRGEGGESEDSEDLTREADAKEILEWRASHVKNALSVINVVNALRTYQVLRNRRIKICTVDTAPTMQNRFQTCLTTWSQELVTEACTLEPDLGTEGRLEGMRQVPRVAKALLAWALYEWIDDLWGEEAVVVHRILTGKSAAYCEKLLIKEMGAARKERADELKKALKTLGECHMMPDTDAERVNAWLQRVLEFANRRALLEWLRWEDASLERGGARAKAPPLVQCAFLCMRPSALKLLSCGARRNADKGASATAPIPPPTPEPACAPFMPGPELLQQLECLENGMGHLGLDDSDDLDALCRAFGDALGGGGMPPPSNTSASGTSVVQGPPTSTPRTSLGSMSQRRVTGESLQSGAEPIWAATAPADQSSPATSPLAARLSWWAEGLVPTRSLLASLSPRESVLLLAAALHTLSTMRTNLVAAAIDSLAYRHHPALSADYGFASLDDIVWDVMDEVEEMQEDIQGPPPLCNSRGHSLPVQTVIMDEAACCTDYSMPVLLSFHPRNLVLVGDPKQLEALSEFKTTHLPVESGGLREYMLHHARSTMERLTRARTASRDFRDGGACSSILRTQYRMHDSVCSVVSRQFYDYRHRFDSTCPTERVLRTDAGVAAVRQSVMLPRDGLGSAAQRILLYPASGRHGVTTAHATGYSNTAEAFVAIFKAKEAFHYLERQADAAGWSLEQRRERFHGPPQWTCEDQDGNALESGARPRIFLLTQYQRQVKLMRSLVLNDPDITPDIAPCFVVQTIDRCQGDEADAVILSLVMAYDHNNTHTRGAKGAALAMSPLSFKPLSAVTCSDFVQYPNRANVAMSRTRYLLVIVASQSLEVSMKLPRHGGPLRRSMWGQVLNDTYEGSAGEGGVPAFPCIPALDEFELRPQIELPHAETSEQPQASTSGRSHDSTALRRMTGALAPDDGVALLDHGNFIYRVAEIAFVATFLVLYHTESLDSLVKFEDWQASKYGWGDEDGIADGAGPGARFSEWRALRMAAEQAKFCKQHPRLLEEAVTRVLQLVNLSPELSNTCKTRLCHMPIFGRASSSRKVLDAFWGKEYNYVEGLLRTSMMAVLEYLLERAVEDAAARGGAAHPDAAFVPADGAGPPQHTLQPVGCKIELQRMFKAREDAAQTLVSREELSEIAHSRVLKVVMASLGVPHPDTPRWGPVRNLFASALDGHGRCFLDPGFAGGESGRCRMPQPRLFFALDWPMADSRWRQLPDRMLQPTIDRVLAAVAEGPGAQAQLSERVPVMGAAAKPGETMSVRDSLHKHVHRVISGRSRMKASSLQDSSVSMLRLTRSLLPNWAQLKRPVADLVAAALKRAPQQGWGELGPNGEEGVSFSTLVVEGVESDDVAGFVARRLTQDGSGHCGPVILVSGDGDWLQYQSHPRVHLLDFIGAVRRPEWSVAMHAGGRELQEAVMYGPLAKRKAAFLELQQRVQHYRSQAPGKRSKADAWLARHAADSEAWLAIRRGKKGELAAANAAADSADAAAGPSDRDSFLPLRSAELKTLTGVPAGAGSLALRALVLQAREGLGRASAETTAPQKQAELRAIAALIANYALCHSEDVLPEPMKAILEEQIFQESWNTVLQRGGDDEDLRCGRGAAASPVPPKMPLCGTELPCDSAADRSSPASSVLEAATQLSTQAPAVPRAPSSTASSGKYYWWKKRVAKAKQLAAGNA